MKEYEKIPTVFERATDGSRKLIRGLYRDETVRYLRDCDWEWTEKVDGTNIRVVWDGHTVSFYGRTDRAIIPGELQDKLHERFGGEENAQLFEQMFGEKEVILFGEGYGRKIQSGGGAYNPCGVDFILFDVFIGDVYLKRCDVEEIARAFGINAVPLLFHGTIDEAVTLVEGKPLSQISQLPLIMEGFVGRPSVDVRDRRGKRIIVKLKVKDFAEDKV